jgi:AraC-like DNA-binding protein
MQRKRSDATRIDAVESFLLDQDLEKDANVARVSEMVFSVARDRAILKVEDLAARYDTNVRMLQRLFGKYVGVTPKWVIQRYRLHEAAQRLASGDVRQTELALSLGYADQAHFVRDFRAVVGRPPAAYVKDASIGHRR